MYGVRPATSTCGHYQQRGDMTYGRLDAEPCPEEGLTALVFAL